MIGTTTHTFFKDLSRVGFNMEQKVSMIANNEISIDEVLEVALSTKQSEARLSCWIITHYLITNKHALDGKIDKAIDFLPFTTHTGQTREILRWMNLIDLKTEKLGQLVDFCFKAITNNTLPIAIKIHAIDIIDGVIKDEPELAPELATILEDILPHVSVGGVNKIKRLIAKYKKQGLLELDY